MSLPAKSPATMESVLIKGDLAKATEQERLDYYRAVCKSIGVNPLTKPFEYITLNGKLQLYALRACTDQLRKINGISLEIVSRDVTDGILTVHVRAKTPDGRTDEDLGSVAFPDTLKGEIRANTELKAVTKAKRRATLSICGLGWLDETEVEDIPSAAPGRKFLNPSQRTAPILPLAEELDDEIPNFDNGAPAQAHSPAHQAAASPSPQPPAAATLSVEEAAARMLETMGREAAIRGRDVFDKFYAAQTKEGKLRLKAIKPELEKLFP